VELIKAWIAEYSLPNYPENLATALLRDMLTKARYVDLSTTQQHLSYHCFIGRMLSEGPAEKAQPKRAMYPMHLFTSTAGSN
jgi:hypothetical protein